MNNTTGQYLSTKMSLLYTPFPLIGKKTILCNLGLHNKFARKANNVKIMHPLK